uniref:cytochrome c oxidase subunit II n=1 Tax=Venerupis aspera TaxID=2784313 RepID=UPI001BEFAD55|nr:cytochrome c oxidase subunit II [Venerupis aspera]YP_010455416.1 cytochrome c oxidase subunit II [Ruditapes variegatus]QUA05871.1 cytochrome c oxidase subunit II [Venerupis aspera]UUA63021.1 cytochrome c oxidase subunit II [Ruditapes variegatus]
MVAEWSGSASSIMEFYLEMSIWDQLNFSNPGTEMAGRLQCYHDTVLVVVVGVLIVVGWFLSLFLFKSLGMGGSLNRSFKKNEMLETAWTIIPSFFLFGLGYVSLVNLYEMEVGDYVEFSVSVVGHQWYWEYQYVLDWDGQFFTDLSGYLKMLDGTCDLLDNMPKEAYFFKRYLLEKAEQLSNDHKAWCEHVLEYKMSGVSAMEKLSHFRATEGCEPGDIASIACNPNWEKQAMEVESYMSKVGKQVEAEVESLKAQAERSEEIIMYFYNECVDGGTSNFWSEGLWELLLSGEFSFRYDSYMVPEDELVDKGSSKYGGFRNQEVTEPCYLCLDVKNEVLVSTADVIHSWGVPELGVKVDAMPGRVSAVSVEPVLSGFYYGFCYELCGAGHSEMPICVVVMSRENVGEVLKSMVIGSDTLTSYLNMFQTAEKYFTEGEDFSKVSAYALNYLKSDPGMENFKAWAEVEKNKEWN